MAQGPQNPPHSAPGTSWGHARTAQLSQRVHISKGSVIMTRRERSSISLICNWQQCQMDRMVNGVERGVSPRALTQPSHETFGTQAGPKMPSTERRAFVLKPGFRARERTCITTEIVNILTTKKSVLINTGQHRAEDAN